MASPLELLDNREQREIPLLSQHFGPIAVGIIGLSCSLYANYGRNRPLLSGVHRHILFTVAGIGIGWWTEKYRSNYLAEKDAVFRHYIELHPEDFPAPVRQKYSEVLRPWVPVR